MQETYGNAGKIKAVKLQSLQRQYELLCMKDQESVADYLGRLQVLVNSMRACDEPVKNSKVVAKILRTLTPQYDHIVVAIEECKDLTTMSLEELQNSLEAHEQRLIERKNNEKSTDQAFSTRVDNQRF